MVQFSADKPRDELLQRIIFADGAPLDVEMKFREHHVARIANDVNQLFISRIEILMALDIARPGHVFEMPLRQSFRVRDQLVKVGEVGLLLGKNQIGDEKPRPGIARLGIGNKKHVVGKNPEVPAGMMQPKEMLSAGN